MQSAIRVTVEHVESVVLEDRTHLIEEPIELAEQGFVVAHGARPASFLERIGVVGAHREIRTHEVDRADPEHEQQTQGHQHHAEPVPLAAPLDRGGIGEIGLRVERVGAAVQHHAGALLGVSLDVLPLTRIEDGIGLAVGGQELQYRRVLPYRPDEAAGRVPAAPQLRAVFLNPLVVIRRGVVDAHRQDAGGTERVQIDLLDARACEHEEGGSALIQPVQTHGLALGGQDAVGGLDRTQGVGVVNVPVVQLLQVGEAGRRYLRFLDHHPIPRFQPPREALGHGVARWQLGEVVHGRVRPLRYGVSISTRGAYHGAFACTTPYRDPCNGA